MSQTPLFSVIVPFRDAADTLGDCADSLAALDYPKDSFEIVFVDNGSSDGSAEIVRGRPNVRLVHEKKPGSYAARNTGIRHARGEALAFTDADCVVDRAWLRNAASRLKSGEAIAGAIQALPPKSLVEEYQASIDMLSQDATYKHAYLPYAQTANALYRRSVFERVGLFEDGWISGGDADLSWRVQLGCPAKLEYAEDCVVYHRHRSTPRSLFLQSRKNVIGACLLNGKYGGVFQDVPDMPRAMVHAKIAWNRLAAAGHLLRYRATGDKKAYFRHLSRVSRLGYLDGYLECLNRRIRERNTR